MLSVKMRFTLFIILGAIYMIEADRIMPRSISNTKSKTPLANKEEVPFENSEDALRLLPTLPNNPPPYKPNAKPNELNFSNEEELQTLAIPQNDFMHDSTQIGKPLNQSMFLLLKAKQEAAEKAQAQQLSAQQAATQNVNLQTGSQQTPMGQSNFQMVKPMTAKEMFGSLNKPTAGRKPTADRLVNAKPSEVWYPDYYYPQMQTPACCQADVFEALCNSKVEPLLQNLIRLSNNQVYYFSPPITAATPGKNWYQAQDFCRSYGMQLLSVETANENTQIINHVWSILPGTFNTGSFWTSLNDFSIEGSYMWAGVGESAWTIPFANLNPSGANADCGEIRKYYTSSWWDDFPVELSGFKAPENRIKRQDASKIPPWWFIPRVDWNDENCKKLSRFICEMICPCDDLINII